MAYQTRKYQPKRLTERHEAILRAIHTGSKKGDVAKRYGISVSQLGRISNSELGRAYLRELHDRATQLVVDIWAALMVHDMVSMKKPHLLNVR